MDTMNLPENITQVVAEQAIAYYLGTANSVEAGNTMHAVAMHGCYRTGILDEVWALFDTLVTYLIDFDVDTWGALSSVGDTRDFVEGRR